MPRIDGASHNTAAFHIEKSTRQPGRREKVPCEPFCAYGVFLAGYFSATPSFARETLDAIANEPTPESSGCRDGDQPDHADPRNQCGGCVGSIHAAKLRFPATHADTDCSILRGARPHALPLGRAALRELAKTHVSIPMVRILTIFTVETRVGPAGEGGQVDIPDRSRRRHGMLLGSGWNRLRSTRKALSRLGGVLARLRLAGRCGSRAFPGWIVEQRRRGPCTTRRAEKASHRGTLVSYDPRKELEEVVPVFASALFVRCSDFTASRHGSARILSKDRSVSLEFLCKDLLW